MRRGRDLLELAKIGKDEGFAVVLPRLDLWSGEALQMTVELQKSS